MSTSRRRLSPLAGLAAGLAAGLLVLSACASGPGSSPAPTSTSAPTLGEVDVAPPDGRVIGVGMVIDVGGEAQLCLGMIMESYPPQCGGIALENWTWEGVDGYERSGETTWGSYAVYGMYDGQRLAVSDPPIMLALFDPVASEDPTGGVDGTIPGAELARIQEELTTALGDRAYAVWTERGYVWVDVVWDDGTLQDAVDAAFGDDVVIVTSALREVD